MHVVRRVDTSRGATRVSTIETYAVADDPFPHILVDGYLDPEIYHALAETFPECGPNTGPTGYTMFWGDADYDALIASNAAWRSLFDRFHDQAFIDSAIAQFSETFERESTVDLSTAYYVPHQESRAEKERDALGDKGPAPDALWVRVDIMQGRVGYCRAPHLDHRRRAISMLIYMCDAEECGLEGGELVLHEADGTAAKTIVPRHNRMVMFPCTPTSFHSVRTIVAQKAPRNFVQVTVSSSMDLWKRAPKSTSAALWSRLRSAVHGLRGAMP
jgi:hypothetical protein